MNETKKTLALDVGQTKALCPVGETVGKDNLIRGRIPVLSCEGACIRGEIARVAANMVASRDGYRRACHGELFTMPDSAMAKWVAQAQKVVLIDGCFLRCHGRILENLVERSKLVQFDALSHYRKYTDRFDIDSVPEGERLQTARSVAEWVLSDLEKAPAAQSSADAGDANDEGQA